MPYDMTDAALRRVLHRPDPGQWRGDELMTILEAAALFYPDGPLTQRSLLTARRDGQLATTMVARRIMTTCDAIRAMGRLKLMPPPESVGFETPMSPDRVHASAAQRALLERLAPGRGKRPGATPID